MSFWLEGFTANNFISVCSELFRAGVLHVSDDALGIFACANEFYGCAGILDKLLMFLSYCGFFSIKRPQIKRFGLSLKHMGLRAAATRKK
jgi:hypothetical protein